VPINSIIYKLYQTQILNAIPLYIYSNIMHYIPNKQFNIGETYEVLFNLFSRNILPHNDVWNCLSSTSGIQLMKKIYNLFDLQLVRDYTKRNIMFLEDELSRRHCNDLTRRLTSFKSLLDELNDDIDNHHQIRRVS